MPSGEPLDNASVQLYRDAVRPLKSSCPTFVVTSKASENKERHGNGSIACQLMSKN
jgi:hypothetical protein